jgi:para-aminobenzoate synthetase/4-amino-4-deoxychorismate lyase
MAGKAPPFVLLDDSLSPDGGCLLFEAPVAVVRCDEAAGVDAALRELSEARGRGLYAAGFLAYELGYALEPRLAGLMPADRGAPLVWMGLFESCQRLDAAGARAFLAARGAGDYRIDGLRPSLDETRYLDAFGRVKDYITAGDVYQVNLTFRYDFDFTGDPLALYRDLRRRQPVAYGAVVAGEDFHILSLSPELFLRVRDGGIETRPMKGTAPRGRTPVEDAARRDWLANDPKSRAENLMIVDLLRNDVGRVADIGSVEVTDLFTVETYRPIHQMTSGVTARLRPDVTFADLVRGLFPCGSVTGAPKIRAMEIIRELEPDARGVYTGAIGMIAPDGDVAFNVAIRTVAIHASGRGAMGIGSGLVHDSDGPAEYEECLLKARFLTEPDPPFALIETMRWQRGQGYYLLDRHLDRLAESAAYFGYPRDEDAVRDRLDRAAEGFADGVQRVRLTLDADGAIEVTAVAIELPADDAVFRYVLADAPTDSDNRFLYHKTTRRETYDRTLADMKRATGCDEVLFVNERGELTEGSYTNLFIERGGVLLTPPVSCGLLDGTFRQALFADPAREVVEAVLMPGDLDTADAVYLGNSVRGLVRAERVT